MNDVERATTLHAALLAGENSRILGIPNSLRIRMEFLRTVILAHELLRS
jgi:hypothetical protein